MSFVIKSPSHRRRRRKSGREGVSSASVASTCTSPSSACALDKDEVCECLTTTHAYTMCNLSSRLLLVLFISLVSTHHAHGASGPTFLDKFTDQTLEPGPSVSLRCIASGQPLPQVTWLVNGQPVPDHSRFRTGDYVTRDLVVVSYVNISSVTAQDGGIYVSIYIFFLSQSLSPCQCHCISVCVSDFFPFPSLSLSLSPSFCCCFLVVTSWSNLSFAHSFLTFFVLLGHMSLARSVCVKNIHIHTQKTKDHSHGPSKEVTFV